MALPLKNRRFDINNSVGSNAREHIITHFLTDITDVDIIIGYRADATESSVRFFDL